MAKFCGNCGTETGGGRFCPKCGSAQQTESGAAYTAPPPPNYVPAAPQAKGSPVLKIVLIVVAVLGLMGIVGVVGVYYFVKGTVQRISAEAKKSGVDLNDLRKSAGQTEETHAGCALLSKEDAGELLGMTVERAEGNEAGDNAEYCKYWTDEKTMAKASEKAEQERQEAAQSASGGNVDSKQLDDLIKGIKVGSGSDGPPPLLAITVFRGPAKIVMAGMKGSSMLLGSKMQAVDGPWDEAVFTALDSAIVLRKGDKGALIDLRQLPGAHKKGLAIAEAVSKAL